MRQKKDGQKKGRQKQKDGKEVGMRLTPKKGLLFLTVSHMKLPIYK